MTVVDANVLLYAVDEDAEHHERARDWLLGVLRSAETVVLPWISLLAFLRISTSPRIYPAPLSVDAAAEIVDAWLSRPNVMPATAGPGHWRTLRLLLEATGAGGNLVTDAHIAAFALELRAPVTTFDNDFGRFPGVEWRLPPAATGR